MRKQAKSGAFTYLSEILATTDYDGRDEIAACVEQALGLHEYNQDVK